MKRRSISKVKALIYVILVGAGMFVAGWYASGIGDGAVDETAELQSEYDALLAEKESLQTDYDNLVSDYETLSGQHSEQSPKYDELVSDYTSLVASNNELKASYNALNADFTELNTLYDNKVSDYDSLFAVYEDISQQLDDIAAVYPPVYFSSKTELETWLADNDLSDSPMPESAYSRMLMTIELQQAALADGYIISTVIEYRAVEDRYYNFCQAVINSTVYWWFPWSDELTISNPGGWF